MHKHLKVFAKRTLLRESVYNKVKERWNKFGFDFKLSDLAFLLGWFAYLGQRVLSLMRCTYGLFHNLSHLISHIYTGKDMPDWMNEKYNPSISKINSILLFGLLGGGLVGFILQCINL